MVRDELVMERFRLVEPIGVGGMGTVYRAFDERLQRHVAVKDVGTDSDRVLREAQAVARLNHPAIVTLYEVGEYEGRTLLVSEFVAGETLDRLLDDGLLADRDVAELGIDLCAALDHAHARGVVHRDVKPQNVILRADPGGGPRAKLMDFGIARVAGAPTLTAAGQVVGTLAYMSPEQAEGQVAGPASDVYSLALTLYECWAAYNPAAGATPAETARRIGAELPSLGEARPDLPLGLVETIDCCLDPEPDFRPSAQELQSALEAALPALDAYDPLLGRDASSAAETRSARRARLVALVGSAAVLGLMAGPLGVPGLALVLAIAATPLLLVAPQAPALAPVAAPLLGAVGAGAAAVGLGAFGRGWRARALLGAGAWLWLICGSVGLGVGPTLGIAEPAPAGWSTDASLAADAVIGALTTPGSVLAIGIFAGASLLLGWIITARHLALAVIGAMLWAAATDGALSLVGDGKLGTMPAVLAAAALAIVAVEFALRRGDDPDEGSGDVAPVPPPAYVANAHPVPR